MQSEAAELPAAELELAGHVVRTPPVQYVPVGHGAHGEPLYPLLQMHELTASAPEAELELLGQMVHVDMPVDAE